MRKENGHSNRGIVVLAIGTLALTAASPALSVTFSQLTSTVGCSGSQFPSLNASADQVAFESGCDLVPGQNPTLNNEIFLMSIDGSELQQLTSSPPPGLSANAGVNASARKITFLSFSDLIPGQNGDFNSEIFLISSDGTGLIQLTNSTGGVDVGGIDLANHTPAMDYSGRQVIFTSILDLVPGQNSDGSTEVFLINADGTGLVQLTATPLGANSGCGRLAASGKKFVFRSDGDWLGQNPDFNGELFLRRTNGSNLVQLTNITGGSGVNETAVDAAGRVAAFSSDSDVVAGGNLDGNQEIFLIDIRTGQVTQLTFTTGGRCFAPSLAANGRSVVFSCDRDLVPGSNADGNLEIFMAEW
ncbi:MAG: TolB family protein [Thermoanaerobaculia bacterium]